MKVTRLKQNTIKVLIFIFLLPAWPAEEALASNCREVTMEEAIQHGKKLTTLLKIATFRADVKYMGEGALDLTSFLDTCGGAEEGRLPLVCDYNCHLQLGRYHLFMASDFPYLSSSSGVSRNDSPLSPQEAQAFAERGLTFVERGLKLLARQQGSSKDQSPGEDTTYREFVRQLTLLNGLKIRLTMAVGDNWYQTVSEARVKRLNFLLSESLAAATGAGVSGDPNLAKAIVYYEKAMWTLIESQMDIPGETTYDDLRSDLFILEKDIHSRMDSVQKGLLFLNIDPMAFTSIKFADLKRKMEETKAELFKIERSVETIVERWHQNRRGEATREIDEKRVVKNQKINLVAHRIGKMEGAAREFTLGVQHEINKVDAEQDSWNFRQQIRRLEMALTTKMAEYENRQRHLNLKEENDLIIMSKEAELEKRNELRWLLNWEMSRMNLDLQLSSLKSQIVEYGRQKGRNDNRLAQLGHEVEQQKDSIEIARVRIEDAENSINSLTARKTKTYMKRRGVIRAGLCGIENELGFIGKTPATPFSPIEGEEACHIEPPQFTAMEYNKHMCGEDGQSGLRQKLIQEQVRAKAFLLQCVVGGAQFGDLDPIVENDPAMIGPDAIDFELPQGVTVNCGNFTTETEFATKLWKKEKDFFEKKIKDQEESKNRLLAQIDTVKEWAQTFIDGIETFEAVLVGVEATLVTVSAIPEITTAVAGLASGVLTKIDPQKAVKAEVETLRNAITRAMERGKIDERTQQKIASAQASLATTQEELADIDIQKAMRAMALRRAQAQLVGRRAAGAHELKELLLKNQIADVDCQSAERGIEERIAVLQAEHARRTASMELTANENELIEFELQAQQKFIDRTEREILIIQRDVERLRLMEEQLKEDNGALVKLIKATRGRIKRVHEVTRKVTDLADASMHVTNVINELRQRQKEGMLALNDNELSFLEQRIGGDQSNTKELIEGLEKAKSLGLKSKDLQGKILEFQRQVQQDTLKEKEELMNLVSQIDDPQEKKNLFIANEETLANLMKGIPEFISAKRRLLATANRTLHLMRRRYSITAGLTGSITRWPSTYVRNATQLGQLVADITNDKFFNERQINIDVSKIAIPANSGFARALALNEHVQFEISPDAVDEEGMKKAGYFTLWDSDKFSRNRNMTLIDMLVGVEYFCSGDHRNKFLLVHKGNGMVFNNLSEGSDEVAAQLVIGPRRSFIRPFYNLVSSLDRVDGILDYWEDTFTVRSFPPLNGPPNDTENVLPYLGVPVIGTYDLKLRPYTCGFDDAEFTLYIIFSSSV